jgi:hypothetical protein
MSGEVEGGDVLSCARTRHKGGGDIVLCASRKGAKGGRGVRAEGSNNILSHPWAR